jgi:hypothetical protein
MHSVTSTAKRYVGCAMHSITSVAKRYVGCANQSRSRWFAYFEQSSPALLYTSDATD